MACIATTPIGKSVGETIETCWESVMDYTTHRFEIPTLQDPRRTNARPHPQSPCFIDDRFGHC